MLVILLNINILNVNLILLDFALKPIIIIIIISLKKNLEAVPGKQSVDSLRKTALLGTSHINTESTAV